MDVQYASRSFFPISSGMISIYGNIVMIDQISFHNLSVNVSSGASIPIIDHSQSATENVGVGM